jgi:hypothetical protein
VSVVFLALVACAAAAAVSRIELPDASDFPVFTQADAIAAPNCSVNQVHVNVVMRSKDFNAAALNMEGVGNRMDPDNLEWVKVQDGSFSCLGAVGTDKVLSTPGGDAGEFLLALKVFEELTGYQLRQRHVSAYLKSFLEKSAKTRFTFCTTTKANTALIESAGAGEVNVLNPPVTLVRTLWDQVIMPDNVGCVHFKLALERAAEYEVRPELTQMLIRAFYMIMWNKEHPQFGSAAQKLNLQITEPVTAEAAPKGLINLLTGTHCLAQGLAPLVAPKLESGEAVYVNHYDSVQVMRHELARFFVALVRDRFSALNEITMLSRMNVVGRHQLQRTVLYLTKDIPVYTITFM